MTWSKLRPHRLTEAQERIGYALLKSAVAVPLVCAAGYTIIEFLEPLKPSLHVFGIVFATVTFFVIGWPLALMLGAVLAINFGEGVQRGEKGARSATIAWATILGLVGIPVVWATTGLGNPHGIMTFTGPVAGLAAGLLFCTYADESIVSGNPESARL